MRLTVRHITAFLDYWAPPSIKFSYDNVGLQAGDANSEVSAILTTLDLTDAVIDEAIENNVNLIVAHHPLIFPTISSVTTSTAIGKLLIKLIKNDIHFYVSHTNLDSIKDGVSFVLAEKLGLQNIEFLSQTEQTLVRFEGVLNHSEEFPFDSFVQTHRESISFVAKDSAHFSLVVDSVKQAQIESELHKIIANPFLKTKVDGSNERYGAGAVGNFDSKNGLTKKEFQTLVCEKLGIESFRFTGTRDQIKRVAVCGGSGSSLIKNAIKAKADAFITADIKYHDYFISNSDLLVLDIGHFETERFIAQTLQQKLALEFPEIPVLESGINTNPMQVFTK